MFINSPYILETCTTDVDCYGISIVCIYYGGLTNDQRQVKAKVVYRVANSHIKRADGSS